jgi:hypothetical protein
MKKLYLFIIGIIISTISAMAQVYMYNNSDISGSEPVWQIFVTPEESTLQLADKDFLSRIANIESINRTHKNNQLVLDSVEYYDVSSTTDSMWQTKTYYKYNSLAQVVEMGHKNSLGFFIERWLYQYDQYENVISEIKQGANSNNWYNISKTERAFDANGNETLYFSMIWNFELSQWVGRYTKFVREYSLSGHQIITESYNWSTNDNNWVGISKSELIYNDLWYATFHLYYSWVSSNQNWRFSHKYLYQYNTLNQQTLYEYYTWDISVNDWRGEIKEISEYNANNLFANFWRYNWDANAWNWRNHYKSNMFYNGDNWWIGTNGYYWNIETNEWELRRFAETTYETVDNLTVQTRVWKTRATLEDSWVNSTKDIAHFDLNRRNVFYYSLSWSTDDWVYVYKQYYAYNNEGYTTFSNRFEWNAGTLLWQERYRTTNSYDDQNRRTLYEYFGWNTSGELTSKTKLETGWSFQGKKILEVHYSGPNGVTDWLEQHYNTYNEQGKVLIYKYEERPTVSSDWITQVIKTDNYDMYGNLVSTNYFDSWDSDGNWFLYHYKSNSTIINEGTQHLYSKTKYWYASSGWDVYYNSIAYYYSPNNPSGAEDGLTNSRDLNVYPNPARSFIHINVEDPGLVQVFSIMGQLIGTFELTSSSKIDISSYAPGLYIIKGGNGTTRFIKK